MHRKCFFVKYEIQNAEIGEILNNLYEKYDFEFEQSIDGLGNSQYEYRGLYCDRFRIIETSYESILFSIMYYEGRNKDKLGAKKYMMQRLSSIPNIHLISEEEIIMDESFDPENYK